MKQYGGPTESIFEHHCHIIFTVSHVVLEINSSISAVIIGVGNLNEAVENIQLILEEVKLISQEQVYIVVSAVLPVEFGSVLEPKETNENYQHTTPNRYQVNTLRFKEQFWTL